MHWQPGLQPPAVISGGLFWKHGSRSGGNGCPSHHRKKKYAAVETR